MTGIAPQEDVLLELDLTDVLASVLPNLIPIYNDTRTQATEPSIRPMNSMVFYVH